MVQSENLKDLGDELTKKLAEERVKLDNLRREKMHLDEQVRLRKIKLNDDTKATKANEQELD